MGFWCIGYITGVSDTLTGLRSALRNLAPCYSTGVTNEQTIRIVIKYLEEHQKDLHEPAGEHVLLALREAFPCEAN